MYNHFTFDNGSNPYISISNKALYFMLTHYYCEQTGENSYQVHEQTTPPKTYAEHKAALQDIAIAWQYAASDLNYSYGQLADWQEFFYEYGSRYGLLREFRENCIPC